jgi:SAM-dependent methyltransferase
MKIMTLVNRSRNIVRAIVSKPTACHCPDPKQYSATMSKGSVVPCQIESYFLALNGYVNEGASVLDVGFGLGYGLSIMAIKAKRVCGVDVDAKAYQYCKDTLVGRNPRLDRLELYDGMHLPFSDAEFDTVTCVDVLEHVDDYHAFLQELLRVCRRGVFISTPNRRPEYTNPNGSPKNHWHLREWSFAELNEILVQHGRVDWNFLDGPFEGPFVTTHAVTPRTLTLSPFLARQAVP